MSLTRLVISGSSLTSCDQKGPERWGDEPGRQSHRYDPSYDRSQFSAAIRRYSRCSDEARNYRNGCLRGRRTFSVLQSTATRLRGRLHSAVLHQQRAARSGKLRAGDANARIRRTQRLQKHFEDEPTGTSGGERGRQRQPGEGASARLLMGGQSAVGRRSRG